MRAQFSLSRAKAKMFKISNSLFSERWIFNEDLSLFFLSADRGMCIQDSLWNDEREEKKKARVVLSSFLSSVCFCAWCVFIVLRKERNDVFLCVVRSVFLLSRVCFFWGHLCKNKKKEQNKKLAGEKCITFLISNACSNSLSTARWIWSLENWFLMSFDVWECIFTRSSARSKTVKFSLLRRREERSLSSVEVSSAVVTTRLLLVCVFEFFFEFFFSLPLLFFKNSNTHKFLLLSLLSGCKKNALVLCLYLLRVQINIAENARKDTYR